MSTWPGNWKVSSKVTVGEYHLTASPTTWVTVSGERGAFKFLRHVVDKSTGNEWIDCVRDIGLTDEGGTLTFHAFPPERVTGRLVTMTTHAAAQHRAPTRH